MLSGAVIGAAITAYQRMADRHRFRREQQYAFRQAAWDRIDHIVDTEFFGRFADGPLYRFVLSVKGDRPAVKTYPLEDDDARELARELRGISTTCFFRLPGLLKRVGCSDEMVVPLHDACARFKTANSAADNEVAVDEVWSQLTRLEIALLDRRLADIRKA